MMVVSLSIVLSLLAAELLAGDTDEPGDRLLIGDYGQRLQCSGGKMAIHAQAQELLDMGRRLRCSHNLHPAFTPLKPESASAVLLRQSGQSILNIPC